jgi:hypothetical protein
MNTIAKFKAFYTNFDASSQERTRSLYADDIVFIDPFKRITGPDNLHRYLRDSYRNVISCQFDFTDELGDVNNALVLNWTMSLSHKRINRKRTYQVHGSTTLKFNVDGKIQYQRDYYDGAELLYSHLPVIGRMIKYVKAKV